MLFLLKAYDVQEFCKLWWNFKLMHWEKIIWKSPIWYYILHFWFQTPSQFQMRIETAMPKITQIRISPGRTIFTLKRELPTLAISASERWNWILFSVSSNNGFCAWWLSPSGENLLLRRRFLNKMDIFRCDGPREKTRRPLKIMYCCGDARDALERKQDRKSLLQKESIMQHVK